MRAPCGEMDIITNPMEYTMNRRTLHLDLLHSGKYRQHIVKAKKGKGAFSRHEKHKKHHRDPGGVFFMSVIPALLRINDGSACPTRCRYWQPAHR